MSKIKRANWEAMEDGLLDDLGTVIHEGLENGEVQE